jgi:hypothetical protein
MRRLSCLSGASEVESNTAQFSRDEFDEALRKLNRARFLTFVVGGAVMPNPILELRVFTRGGREVPLGDRRADPESDALVAILMPGIERAYPDGDALLLELANGILTEEIRASTAAEADGALSDLPAAIRGEG